MHATLTERLLDALIVNWPLVLVGIGGIWTAICALKPSRDAANAALLNARAVIDAERPWMIVTVEADPLSEGCFFFRAVNKGRTPANIVSACREMCIAYIPDMLPLPPHYSSPMYVPPDNLRVTDDPWNDHPSFCPDKMNVSAIRRVGFNEENVGAGTLCCYGEITYTDAFPDKEGRPTVHSTRWCYAYNPIQRSFSPTGPEEYRSKT